MLGCCGYFLEFGGEFLVVLSDPITRGLYGHGTIIAESYQFPYSPVTEPINNFIFYWTFNIGLLWWFQFFKGCTFFIIATCHCYWFFIHNHFLPKQTNNSRIWYGFLCVWVIFVVKELNGHFGIIQEPSLRQLS